MIPPQPGQLAVLIAMQRQEPHADQQADDAEVNRRADQPGDPDRYAEIQAQLPID